MSAGMCALVLFLAVNAGLWAVSFLMEAMRRAPKAPASLSWAPEVPISTVDVAGTKLRYVKSGSGPPIVLLHTLRTQLDLFAKVIPGLSREFTVYALDYPGHGFSDIPKGRYDADFFATYVEGFLNKLDIRDATLAGVSIGGAIPLILASKRNPRVRRVVAINPYDYAKGRGMARSSFLGWMINYAALVPFFGETVMRLRNFIIMKAVFRGGVADPKSIPPALLKEMYLVGNRTGHYRAFISLLRNSASWEAARREYGKINIPVLLVWGDKDWARTSERQQDHQLIPGAKSITVENGGHFLAFDRPDEVQRLVRDSARS